MQLNHDPNAIAGKGFSVELTDFVGTGHLSIYLDQELIAQKTCNDPPCHEVALIPPGTAGKILRIVGTDGSESRKVTELKIGRR